MNLDSNSKKGKKDKRCPNGTRKNKKTGICEPITVNPSIVPPSQVDVIEYASNVPAISSDKSLSYVRPSQFDVSKPQSYDDSDVSQEIQSNIDNSETSIDNVEMPLETVKESVSVEPSLRDSIVSVAAEKVIENSVENVKSMKEKRCPNGTRKNPKTGICEPIKKRVTKKSRELELPERPTATPVQKSIVTEIQPPVENVENVEVEPIEDRDTQINIDSSISALNKDSNSYLLKKEKMEYDYNAENDDYDFLYPELNDPNFNIKIAKRKEFNDTKYDGTIHDIKKQANILCNAKFELMPHQLFVKNFMSFQTPYNSLLLFNALGSGKTCSAIGIAEEMRSYMKQIGIKQRIIVVASPNVQSNFRLQLFDERKLELIRNSNVDTGLWNIESCVGNALINEVNPTQLKGLPRDKVISHIKRIINNYYLFMGYGQLANYISNSIKDEKGELTGEALRKMEIRKIKKIFNNRLIIIDEVHNIRLADDNNSEKKKKA